MSISQSFVLPPALDSTADVIVQSCDGVPFRLHKVFLAAASSAFESTFLLPGRSSTASIEPTLPIVELSETGDVLALMLSYIYPVDSRVPLSLDALKGALRAAKKYDISTVAHGLRPHLMRPAFMEENPLAVFGIARVMGFDEEARVAYFGTLKLDNVQLTADPSSAEDLSGPDLARILNKRQERAKKIIDCIETHLDDDDGGGDFRVPQCYGEGCLKAVTWVGYWECFAEQELLKRASQETLDLIFSIHLRGCFRRDIPNCVCGREAAHWEEAPFREFRDHLGHLLKVLDEDAERCW